MKKRLLVILLFSLPGLLCQARGGATKMKLADWEEHGTFDAANDLPLSRVTLSWRSESFPNANFYGSTLREELIPSFGFDLGYSYRLLGPLEFSLIGFYSRYKTHYDAGMDEGETRHSGIELSLHYYVLPNLGVISRYLFPYVGAGYQTSRLINENASIPQDERYTMTVGTGGFIMEGGLRVFAIRGDETNFFLFAAYKQTLPVSSQKMFRSLHLGVGYNF